MNETLVDNIARALLYEGYVLYPYRPSVKSQQRWTFGGVYPPSWSEAQEGTDPSAMQTQCLLETGSAATVRVRIRFLHLVDRTIGKLDAPLDELPSKCSRDACVASSPGNTKEATQASRLQAIDGDLAELKYHQVQGIGVGEKQYQPWQEAVERDVDLDEIDVRELLAQPRQQNFSFPRHRTIEPLRAPGAPIIAILIRQQETLEGTIELSAAAVEENLIRVSVRILNRTEMADAGSRPRDDAMMRSLVSAHTILSAQDAKFISLTDPPVRRRAHASQCTNIGAWPVLVGEPGDRGTMLASPIIVEDYPKIAPESPGDLFDGTEIDEILTLRIMTLTDEEKRLAAGVDQRVSDLMARTQSLARDQLMGLHGTLREVAPLPSELSFGDVHESANTAHLRKVVAHGVELKAGDSVRLRPLGRADVMDIALDGKLATIASIEQDFENRTYVAVTIDDDPGKDLGLSGQPGHRFFFGIEEVEPLNRTEAAI